MAEISRYTPRTIAEKLGCLKEMTILPEKKIKQAWQARETCLTFWRSKIRPMSQLRVSEMMVATGGKISLGKESGFYLNSSGKWVKSLSKGMRWPITFFKVTLAAMWRTRSVLLQKHNKIFKIRAGKEKGPVKRNFLSDVFYSSHRRFSLNSN